VEFCDGSTLRRSALFFDTECKPQSRLAESLGCRLDERGGVRRGRYEATEVPGLYVAGNILRDVHLAIVAAAEGAKAAFGINKALTREAYVLRATGAKRIEHHGP
jgi:thioredoxin reductase